MPWYSACKRYSLLTMRNAGPAIALAASSLCGCSAWPGATPDAGEPDATDAAGLVVRWAATTAIPGAAGKGLRIDEAVFELQTVRALGDAATGEHTTATDVQLRWGAAEAPTPLAFDAAPPGRYSSLELRLAVAGGFHLIGEVELDGSWEPFEIFVDEGGTFDRPIDVMLAPGETVEIDVTLDLAGLIAEIDFEEVEPTGGVLVIDAGEPAYDNVLGALAELLEGDGDTQEAGLDGDQP